MYPTIILSFLTLVPLSWAQPTNVSLLIEQINSKQSSWKAGPVSPDDDIRPKLGFLGLHPDPTYQPAIKEHKIGKTVIPETFSALKQWPKCKDVIGNIRNQGNCGSCWAFSAAEVMSDRLCIETNGETQFEFSPEDLVSCCGSMCGKGCQGGYTIKAWNYFVLTGIVSGGDYDEAAKGCQPYVSTAFTNGVTPQCQKTCLNVKYNVSYQDDKHFGDEFYAVPSNVEQIQTEIMTNGPVQVGYTVYEDFKYYKYGVYYHISGQSLGGHAVKIIGWGTEGGVPYWLVANSWGADWAAYGGYFKIRRGTNECGIEGNVIAGKPYTGKGRPSSTTQAPGSAPKIAGSGLAVILAMIYFYFARF